MRDGERKLVIGCIKEKEKEKNNRLECEDRELFLRQNGYSLEEIRLLKERGVGVVAIIKEREWVSG